MGKKIKSDIQSDTKDTSNFKENFLENWEDPLVLKKQGITYLQKKDISYYKKRIIDEKYMEHAIQRIALELSHFILKDR